MDMPANFTSIYNGFQLREFSKKLSVTATCTFVHLSVLSQPFSVLLKSISFNDHTCSRLIAYSELPNAYSNQVLVL